MIMWFYRYGGLFCCLKPKQVTDRANWSRVLVGHEEKRIWKIKILYFSGVYICWLLLMCESVMSNHVELLPSQTGYIIYFLALLREQFVCWLNESTLHWGKFTLHACIEKKNTADWSSSIFYCLRRICVMMLSYPELICDTPYGWCLWRKSLAYRCQWYIFCFCLV